MTLVLSSTSFKLAAFGVLSIMTIAGCGRKFSRLDSGVTGGSSPINPINPVNPGVQNATVTFSGSGGSGSTFATSAVVYVVGGNSFYTARDANNVPTTGGYDGDLAKMTALAPIPFTVSPATASTTSFKVVPYDTFQSPFCNNVIFAVQNGGIILKNDATNKLMAITTCNFKLTSTAYNLAKNQMTFLFNYTVKDWASPLGAGTAAQVTANLLIAIPGVQNQTSLNKSSSSIVDISPITSLVNLTKLVLDSNPIYTIPDSIAELSKLQFLEINNIPTLTSLPNTMTKLSSITNLQLENDGIETVSPEVYAWMNSNTITTKLYDGNPGYPNFGN